ncbi:MAG: hypothetical protein KIPDCIKN_00482 [Haliscomenobacter sp.]|jgi:tetratricopeptide (TPR) repeat protein|nr:hypothetical protein [Haliscomenobacter sp.]
MTKTEFVPFVKMIDRLNNSKQESDVTYFFDLLYFGELLTKVVVLGLVSGVADDKERNRYRLVHRLVRADGIGEWNAVLEELMTGVASHYLFSDIRHHEQHELNQKTEGGTWQYSCVSYLYEAMNLVGISIPKDPPKKIQAKIWFSNFATLRNGTRGHGATLPSNCSKACLPLENSINLMIENFFLFKRDWVFLHQNISGKYRVSRLTNTSNNFDNLKSDSSLQSKYESGLYVYFESRTKIELILSSPEIDDFYFPNGNFKERSYELISYITDKRKEGDSSQYLIPASELPSSETEGLGRLEVVGNYFSNIPPIYSNYVNRKHLEDELIKVITDKDRYPIITLKGIGGIGKTSLALSVLHKVSTSDRFDVVLWLSSRDIDLTTQGAKHVKNKILNEEDIANQFADLLDVRGLKKNEKIEFLSKEMGKSSYGPMLFVFDNFETVKNPVELFSWIDTYVRHPNKVLITSRTSKSFKADYPIEVSGMNTEECEILIAKTATEFGISQLLFQKDIEKIIQESSGHPYVIRIFLGEIAKSKKVGDIKRIVASKEDILTALFRRTFTWLSPAAKRVFLTLCSWRSVIPQIALEAVLLRENNERINVDDAIEELRKSSFIELTNSEKDNEVFITVPLAASIFGKSELEVSSEKLAILTDRELLQDFGASQQSDIVHGITPRIKRKFHSIANRISQGNESLEAHLPTLEFIASKYPNAWTYLANIHEENNDKIRAQESYREFLKSDSSEFEKQRIWQKLADSYRSQGEWFSEVNALVEMCNLSCCSFFILSEVSNVINSYFQNNLFNIDSEIKHKLVIKMVELMESRSSTEVTSTDYSRLAWLYLRLNNTKKAIEITNKGLAIDQTNDYCQKLAIRLGID